MLAGMFAPRAVTPPVAFAQWLGAIGTADNTQATSHNVSMPATVSAGDLLIMQFATSAAVGITHTTPSGWSLLLTNVGAIAGGSSFRSSIFYKIANGSEGGTQVSVAVSASVRRAAIVNRIAAGTFDTAAPLSGSSVYVAATPNPDPPVHSPPWGAGKTLWIVGYGQRNSPGSSFVVQYPYPQGNTLARTPSTGTAYVHTASCVVDSETASLDPGAFGSGISTGGSCVGFTLAVRPAS